MSAAGEFDLEDCMQQLREAVSDDLLMLAALHSEELTAERINQLKEVEFPKALGLKIDSEDGAQATELMQAAVAMLSENPETEVLDTLAADFADIYLTYKLHASPCESVWVDEDGLTLQEPMFEIRRWYEKYGVAAENWRQRSDDHLVLQLQFIAHLFGLEEDDSALEEAALFMDEHILRWIEDYSRRVATRCSTPFYAGLSALTVVYLDELRDLLQEVLGQPRPTLEEIEERIQARKKASAPSFQDIPLVSVPASDPSW